MKFMTNKDVALALQVTIRRVNRLLRANQIRHLRVGDDPATWRIRESDLQAYIDSRTVETAQPRMARKPRQHHQDRQPVLKFKDLLKEAV